MQSPFELKETLLSSLDKDYNVVDMATVIEVISILEKLHITKEALERTRLGKYVNELRKRTSNEQLARRAKDLVKGWRKLIPQTENTVLNGERLPGGITPPGPGPGGKEATAASSKLLSAPRKCNARYKPASPAVSCERLASPLSLSASNSPLLQQQQPLMKSNSINTTSYAPVILSGLPSNHSGHSSPNLNTMPNVFKPVSPALLAVKLNKPSTPNSDSTTVACPKVNSSRLSPRVVPSAGANSSSSSTPRLSSKASQDRYSDLPQSENDLVHSSSVDLSKTNPANKRLRKHSEEDNDDSINGHSHKRVIVNGIESNCEGDKVRASKWSAFESVRSSSVEECSPEDSALQQQLQLASEVTIVDEVAPKQPKKRGRHPVVKQAPSDTLKEKMAAAQSGRYHKVKTTQQLIEDIHAKNVVAPGTLAVTSPSSISDELNKHDNKQRTSVGSYPFFPDPETSKTKSELMDRFLKSTGSNSKPTSPGSSSLSEPFNPPSTQRNTNENSTGLVMDILKTPGMIDKEIADLLKTLPEIDPSVLEQDEEEVNDGDELPSEPRVIGDEELDRLSTGVWPQVNGVYDYQTEFRPWENTVTLASQNQEFLHILPYVNIDW